MGITYHYGQASYIAKSEKVKIITSIQNACTTPYFMIDDKEICPYWTAPWWEHENMNGDILSTLRGNFICVAKTEDYNDPEHGYCCCSPWELSGIDMDGSTIKMVLEVDEPSGGFIRKTLRTDGSNTAVYEENELNGISGEYSVSNHPCLKLPKDKSQSCFSMTDPETIVTPKIFCETPEKNGYMLFPRNIEIGDWHHVRTIYGEELDLAHHPAKQGTVELLMMAHKPQLVFCALVNKEEGYIYYQLKNAKTFPYILFWMFSGGRHYAPWNGTQDGCLGVEDSNSYLPFMRNDIEETTGRPKYNTSVEFSEKETYTFRQIYGVVKLPDGMNCVENITFAKEGIELAGDGGIRIKASVDWEFLV